MLFRSTFVIPNLFGADGPFANFWGAPSAVWAGTGLFLARNMGVLYLGALPVVTLILWGLARGGAFGREALFFTTALFFVLLYAAGWYTPAFYYLHLALPGADYFRRAADATFYIAPLAAILTGWLIGRVIEGHTMPVGRSGLKIVSVILLLVFAIGILVAVAFGQVPVAYVAILLAEIGRAHV